MRKWIDAAVDHRLAAVGGADDDGRGLGAGLGDGGEGVVAVGQHHAVARLRGGDRGGQRGAAGDGHGAEAAGFGVTHTLLAEQVLGAVQVPHSAVRLAPQLSVAVTEPQFLPRRLQKAASVSGAQQTLGRAGAGGGAGAAGAAVRVTPQLSVPLTVPQFLPRRLQKAALLSGVQAEGGELDPGQVLRGGVEQHLQHLGARRPG